MSYEIHFISPFNPSECPDEHYLPDAAAAVLNYALAGVKQPPLSEWNPKIQGHHAEGGIAKAIAYMLTEPTACLWAMKETTHEDYEDAIWCAMQLWKACRSWPDHNLRISF